MVFESLQYYFEMVCMIVFSTGVNKNVIYEEYDEHVQVLLEHTVHQVHEGCLGIGKTNKTWLKIQSDYTKF